MGRGIEVVTERIAVASAVRHALDNAVSKTGRQGRDGLASAFESLRGALGFDCASLTGWNAIDGRHHTIVDLDYPSGAMLACDDLLHTDPTFWRIRTLARAVRLRDLAPPLRTGPVVDHVISAFDFTDGLTRCLFTHDGRYVGALNLSTKAGRHIDDIAVALVEVLAADLARALDPAARDAARTRYTDDEGALILQRDGTVRALTANADVAMLLRAPRAASLARQVASGAITAPVGERWILDGPTLHTVRIESTVSGALVVASPSVPPAALTVREMQVLACLTEGSVNTEIAHELGIARSTVAAHVETILRKLALPSRTAAAAFAAEHGLERAVVSGPDAATRPAGAPRGMR